MTQFNANQPEQNSKSDLVEAWKIAHAENAKLSKRVVELAEAQSMKGIELTESFEQGYSYACELLQELADAANSNGFDALQKSIDDLSNCTDFFESTKQTQLYFKELNAISDEACEHNWVDATNPVVKNGFICTKCKPISGDGEG